MAADERPALVAYDGSAEATEAVRVAATLFAGRPLVVVTVWEPGLALAMGSTSDPFGIGSSPPSVEEVAAIERAQRDLATAAADEGARDARELGATVEPVAVPDEADVPATIAAIADRRDACVVVVGSRGLGRVKAGLLGSTSNSLLRRTQLPVLVVRAAPASPGE